MPTVAEVSVIICTFNRADLLDQCLHSLVDQDFQTAINWEVIIVNNNSSDHTLEICRAFEYKLPLRLFNEPRQGKTYALNTALHHARGNLLLFTDDDVRLDSKWISQMVHACRKHVSYTWFGGRVMVDWTAETPKPHWLDAQRENQLRGFFVSHDHGSATRPYATGDLLPLGANLAVRAEAFAVVGPFRTDLGPRGEQRGVDDETEWIQRARSSGMEGIYIPDAICWHHMDAKRLTLQAYYTYGLAKGRNALKQQSERKPTADHLLSLVVLSLKTIDQAIKGNAANLRLCLIRLGYQMAWFDERFASFMTPRAKTNDG